MFEEIIELMKQNQYIPTKLVDYTERILECNKESKYKSALIENSSVVINKIASMIQDSAKATGLTPEDLFNQSGFKKRDLDPTRIESFFAELRTINYLYTEGFHNIRYIKTSTYKSADLYAEKNKLRYVIEVTNSGSTSTTGRWKHNDLVKLCLIKLRSEKKFEQLKDTRDRESCDKMVLAVVVDKEDKVALNCSDDYKAVAQEAWVNFGKIKSFHICIITGRETLGYGKDDIVYPSWDLT